MITEKRGAMFTEFFFYLRAHGLKVSLNEWMMLCEALDKGLAGATFTGFYQLCRAVLVKSEADYDKFDRIFLAYFEAIAKAGDRIPQSLQDWLDHPGWKPDNWDPESAEFAENLTPEEIEDMLRVRMQEQDSEHNGGNYWIGTGGMSAFGNDGNTPQGIRVGGTGHYHRALRVAGERRFRDFTRDRALDLRQFQVAFRYLRQYSSRTDEQKTVLNAEKTAQATGENGGVLDLVYERPRRNQVKVVMMIDSGGSMEYYSRLCSTLFQAVSKSNRFKDLKIYYFHNCIYKYLYTRPQCRDDSAVLTEQVLRTLDREYKLIIVGDAEMAPYELMTARYPKAAGRRGIDWMRDVRDHFSHSVWLNPGEGGNYWDIPESYTTLKREFDMYYLTVDNLVKAMKKLIAAR